MIADDRGRRLLLLARLVTVPVVEWIIFNDVLTLARVAGRRDLLAQGLLALPALAECSLVVLAGMVLALAVADDSSEPLLRPRPFFNRWLWLHLAVVGLCLLTGRLILAPHSSRGTFQTLGWLALGAAAALTLVLWLAPAWEWTRLVREHRWRLSSGLIVGLVLWTAARGVTYLEPALSEATLWSVHGVLSWIDSGSMLDAERRLVGIAGFSVRVAPGCSGVDGMALIAGYMLAALWLFRSRLRFPRAFLLIPIAGLLSWGLNVLRIVLLVKIGAEFSREVAVAGFHSQSGWVFFNITGLTMVGLALTCRWFQWDESSVPSEPTASETGPFPAGLYLLPFLVLGGLRLICLSFSEGFSRYEAIPVFATAIVLLHALRRHRPRWTNVLSVKGSITAMLSGIAVAVLWRLLDRPDVDTGLALREQVERLGSWEWGPWIAARCVGTIVVVPLAEELAFRGYLMRRLQGTPFDGIPYTACGWLAWVGSSLCFGLLHSEWIAATISGLVFGALAIRFGRLHEAIVAHAVANLIITIEVLSLDRWWLWT